MADAVNRALTLLMLACLGACAHAAGVVDPTQPPPGYGAMQRSGDPQLPDAAARPEPIRLQMIARNGASRLAVVNGQRVQVGDSITLDGKSARVVAIGDDSILLDRSGSRQLVQLSPHAQIKLACAAHSSNRPGCRNDTVGAAE